MSDKKFYDPSLDVLRILGSLGVILIHISGFYLFSTPIGSDHRWLANIADSFSRWSVPIFFMISGILLLRPEKVGESLQDFFSKRISKVIIPYIARNIIYFLIREIGKGHTLSLQKFTIEILNNGVYPYHLWFLSALIGIYCIVPFLRILIAHASKQHLYALSLGFIVFSSINHFLKFNSGLDLQSLGFTPSLFSGLGGYTILGYTLRNDEYLQKKLSSSLSRIYFISMGIVISVGTGIISTKNNSMSEALYHNGHFLVIILSCSCLLLAKYYGNRYANFLQGQSNIIKKLSVLTLGVYIIHPIVLEIMTNHHVISIFGHQGYIHYTVSFIVIVIVSFLATFIAHRIPYIRQLLPA